MLGSSNIGLPIRCQTMIRTRGDYEIRRRTWKGQVIGWRLFYRGEWAGFVNIEKAPNMELAFKRLHRIVEERRHDSKDQLRRIK